LPLITYRRGASGLPVPVLNGTGIRVQTIMLASRHWNLSVPEIAEDFDLTEEQVRAALSFYASHRDEIDALIADERQLELANT
jgi:uncharacterized protein (DUF433 family)